ncbi:MAG: hypothetical protein A3F72_12040 [Bacteroidetes bacterium RIFCSPLOWO2_12_FULL_35_15]|nr:MAG: hypothetical protein A3F72_12040 [Bacteroidetes bacterium RIFCSPLOWO2_12_FULL_35_15]
MKKYFLFSFFLVVVLSTISAQEINVAQLKKHIKFLASDKLKGRGTGTQDELTAANYIRTNFSNLKLEPKGNINSYYFSYTFKKPKDAHDTIGGESVSAIDVAGYLDNGAENTVVIGAHFDHLGMGLDNNSLDPNSVGKIHNGADDNASGVAGVIELARYFSQNQRREKFNFLFICFSGEELGLFGSKKFCENPTIDFSKVNYMINMDMIGRLNDTTKKLIIYGVGTAPDWVSLIDKTNTDFSIKKDSAGIGASDQTSFYLKDIPVLHFFTGQHSDYHKPSDDFIKINFKGEKKVLEYIIKIEEETEKLPKFQFLKTKNPDAGTRKFKITMGVMPDYTYEGKGMRIDGVTDGKPASRAGIQKGDVVIQFGEIKVESTMDYMKGLSAYKIGDTVEVTILRNGKEIKLNVTF